MGRPVDDNSLRSLTALLGTSTNALHRVQLFVAFAERYPWLLRSLTQGPILQIRRALQTIPPDEHAAMMALLQQYGNMKSPELVRAAFAWCSLPETERRLLYSFAAGIGTAVVNEDELPARAA
jgi:hypothetical protein